MARVLAISSHVARGHVGLDRDRAGAAVARPRGVGAADGTAGEPAGARPAGEARPAAGGSRRPCWPRWRPTAAGRSLDAVFTGYFPSPAVRGRRGARRSPASRRPSRGIAGAASIRSSATRAGSTSRTDDRGGHPRPAAAAGHHRHAQPVRAAMADRRSRVDDRDDIARAARSLGPPTRRRHVGRCNAEAHRHAAGGAERIHRACQCPRAPAFPTAPATCSPGCCSAICSTGIPARPRSTPASPTSIACLPPARAAASCSSRHS